MLQRIIRAAVLTGVLLSIQLSASHAKYLPLDGSIKADDTYRLLVRNNKSMALNFAYATSDQAGPRMDSVLNTIDGTFKGTRYVLKGQGSMQQKMNYLSSSGFFDLGLVLLNSPHTLIVWLACKEINVLFVELQSSISIGVLIDKLFGHSIVDRFAELALSNENSILNEVLMWRETLNTVKEEASKSILLVTQWSNDRQLDTLVGLGALDVACHLARTLKPPDDDKILLALDGASKLLSTAFHGHATRVTPFGDNALKHAKLCNASENYCRYYNCFDEHGKLKDIGLILLVFLVSFSSAAAFLWLLWTSLEPVKSKQNTNTKKETPQESDVDATERNENQCTKCGKIVPVSGTKECSKCGVVYCSRSCQKADVSVYLLFFDVTMMCT